MNGKPHIRFERNYSYAVYKDRVAAHPMAVTSNPRRLPKIGPWRPEKTVAQWSGDATLD